MNRYNSQSVSRSDYTLVANLRTNLEHVQKPNRQTTFKNSQEPVKKSMLRKNRTDSMRLPDLGSSIESNVSAAIEWKKNLSSPRELELINKRREKNVSFPKVDMLDNFKI